MTSPDSPTGSEHGGKVNLAEELAMCEELWSRKIVGQVNHMHAKLAPKRERQTRPKTLPSPNSAGEVESSRAVGDRALRVIFSHRLPEDLRPNLLDELASFKVFWEGANRGHFALGLEPGVDDGAVSTGGRWHAPTRKLDGS